MPDLVGLDAVQRGNLSALEQEVDRGRKIRVIGLAEAATLGMGEEFQFIDPVSRLFHFNAASKYFMSSNNGAIHSMGFPVPGCVKVNFSACSIWRSAGAGKS